MCGRFTLTTPAQQLQTLFDQLEIKGDLEARFNIAPTQSVLGVRKVSKSDRLELSSFRWGLIPSWSENPNALMLVNTRCETMSEKPSFREAFRKRRCLIPADGFFEWKSDGSKKQPYWIHRPNLEPFVFAGLWESWVNDAGKPVESCTVVTTVANKLLRPLHERMPVIVSREWHEAWLDPENRIEEFAELFRPQPEDFLQLRPVSTLVNSAKVDHAKCIESLQLPQIRQLTLWEE